MKIVHVVASAPYNDYWGYQDNLLPKYQHKLGHAVTVITTNTLQKNGVRQETTCGEYDLNDGVHIIRLKLKHYRPAVFTTINDKLLGLFDALSREMPDFVFFHGLSSISIMDVIRYKKRVNPACVIVQDNHLDYNIAHIGSGLKKYLLRGYYRCINRISVPYVKKVYGVTPWRKQFAQEYFGIPAFKTDVLIMGADDEKLDFTNRDRIRKDIREQYGIGNDEFLIVTGGKLDEKKHVLALMQACKSLPHVKLLIFGSVQSDIKDRFEALLKECDNIIYIGWIASDLVYSYFFAADLAVFPGQHSVLWEQACAAKVPCLFAKWEGMNHVNNGGNSRLLEKTDAVSLEKEISLLSFSEAYDKMKSIALSDATDIYLYSKIAEKSMECMAENEE